MCRVSGLGIKPRTLAKGPPRHSQKRIGTVLNRRYAGVGAHVQRGGVWICTVQEVRDMGSKLQGQALYSF